MKSFNKNILATIVLVALLFSSCKDLTELNLNPNGIPPSSANPNFLLSTVLSETGKTYVNLGFGDLAGVMQHTQKDAWATGHNDYDWSDQSWSFYYNTLRTNQKAYVNAENLGWEFQMGVSKVMEAFLFGQIADLWGDAPYTNALNGNLGGEDNLLPAYDSQETIYKGIIETLKEASVLLSKNKDEYTATMGDADLYLHDEPMMWRKFANSLLLRYYMRFSEKDPSFAKSGVEGIYASGVFISDNSEDAMMDFVGNSAADSWPSNWVYDASGSGFRRIKMCGTIVETLQGLSDPRLSVWANKVEIPLVVDASLPAGTDEVREDGKRYIHPDMIPAETLYDTDDEYVGIPPSIGANPSWYNLNPTPGQNSYNPHVSYLNDIYKDANGELLKARLISATEVSFLFAEAALKGWSTGDAKTHYEAAVKSSFEFWGVVDDYDAYIAQAEVTFDNSLEQLMTQKWIASWGSATESWSDYRRTGFPQLEAGPKAKREKLPVRFYYSSDTRDKNPTNFEAALENLEETNYSRTDGKNSAWSKPWLLQGMNNPW
ncbi:SusD/RagB family nutrient-binding outer membrane lipoprotein [Flammeovirgaceae bacterium SG7u.111]|nr:SusD/RagB family nutrient-binding outer membrane lipoprotein [Flammeovirgaceae bacterium SG7u.132]WPO33243.1 SusD/RagB family nutrient-binding outer membrane lipoprotein [Flammeovirgaceae bacterium SG7u.111]